MIQGKKSNKNTLIYLRHQAKKKLFLFFVIMSLILLYTSVASPLRYLYLKENTFSSFKQHSYYLFLEFNINFAVLWTSSSNLVINAGTKPVCNITCEVLSNYCTRTWWHTFMTFLLIYANTPFVLFLTSKYRPLNLSFLSIATSRSPSFSRLSSQQAFKLLAKILFELPRCC